MATRHDHMDHIDDRAWIIRPYINALRAFFAKRVAPHEVDDMVQDVAVRMQQRPETEIGNVEGYLFQVARSVLTDHARRGRVRSAGRHVSIEDYHHPAELRSPARIAEGREELALVLAAIRRLPDRARQVFVLHRFEEMSYQAIAREMGISVSAVEKHIMKAIRILGASLG